MSGSSRRSFRSFFAVVAAALSLAACGGGGSSNSGGIAPPGGGGNGSGAGGGGGANTLAPASVSVSFLQYQPVQTAGRRRTAFISPATQSISLSVIVANGSTVPNPTVTTFNVGPSATNCTGSGATVTCSATIDAPVGTDVIAISSFSGPNGSGGNPLGTTQAPVTIVQNSTNRIPLSLGGTIASLELYLSKSNLSVSSPKSLVVIVPLDASGAVIVNPGDYNPSINVTSSDTTGAFSLILDNGAPSAGPVTVASPNDQVVLSYSGNGTTPVSTTVTATAGTATASSNAHAGSGPPALRGAGSGTGFTGATPDQFIFTAIGQTANIAVSGGTPPYTIVSSDPTVASVGGTSPAFTVTSTGLGANLSGNATVTISDSATTPNHFTYPVTVEPPALALAVASCGTAATCTPAKITFPQGPTNPIPPQETGTITASGGTGVYTFYFASSGTTTSVYANVVQGGANFTITPTGTGNDTLIVQSGAQSALYAIVTGSPVAAVGMLIEGTSTPSRPKNFAIPEPGAVTAVALSSGPAISALALAANTLTGAPSAAGNGSLTFTINALPIAVPFTSFGVVFATYGGSGASSPAEIVNAAGADEAFTANGQSDTVTVTGVVGTLTAGSSNPNLVSVTAAGNTLTVTSAATGNGFATITLYDSGTGASAAYSVSVTTTTIPVASHNRE